MQPDEQEECGVRLVQVGDAHGEPEELREEEDGKEAANPIHHMFGQGACDHKHMGQCGEIAHRSQAHACVVGVSQPVETRLRHAAPEAHGSVVSMHLGWVKPHFDMLLLLGSKIHISMYVY